MITPIAAWLLAHYPSMSNGTARHIVKIAFMIIAVAAVVGGFALWLNDHDANVVETHETKARLEQATTALESERRATGNALERETARDAAAEQSTEAMKEAENADPEAARAPAGPVSRAAARRFSVRT
jgi:NhaP-type Na+/H+ or K+/H+ antiporter